jgi:hypothetical protein
VLSQLDGMSRRESEEFIVKKIQSLLIHEDPIINHDNANQNSNPNDSNNANILNSSKEIEEHEWNNNTGIDIDDIIISLVMKLLAFLLIYLGEEDKKNQELMKSFNLPSEMLITRI